MAKHHKKIKEELTKILRELSQIFIKSIQCHGQNNSERDINNTAYVIVPFILMRHISDKIGKKIDVTKTCRVSHRKRKQYKRKNPQDEVEENRTE
jgi:hypothetical protein